MIGDEDMFRKGVVDSPVRRFAAWQVHDDRVGRHVENAIGFRGNAHGNHDKRRALDDDGYVAVAAVLQHRHFLGFGVDRVGVAGADPVDDPFGEIRRGVIPAAVRHLVFFDDLVVGRERRRGKERGGTRGRQINAFHVFLRCNAPLKTRRISIPNIDPGTCARKANFGHSRRRRKVHAPALWIQCLPKQVAF